MFVSEFYFAYRTVASVKIFEHSHPGAELVLVTRGDYETVFDRKIRLTAHPGDVYVTPPGMPHTQEATPNRQEAFYTVFRDNGFSDRLRIISTGEDPYIRNYFSDLAALYQDNRPEECQSLLETILRRLQRFESDRQRADAMHPFVRKMHESLERRWNDPSLKLSVLARETGGSPNYVHTLFAAEFGCGASQYLQNKRLEAARQMLEAPYLRLSEIAERCGFSDQNYFCRVFRRRFRQSPSDYRRLALTQKPRDE